MVQEFKTILITGGSGFIGSHVVEYFLQKTNWKIIVLDRIDQSSTLKRLEHLRQYSDRLCFIWHDLKSEINKTVRKQIGYADYTIHLAGSTHVDRSIIDPLSFIQDNVIGTHNWLEYCRECEKGIYFSTDEVFGDAPEGVVYEEWDRYCSRNPYAATKAGAEELCLAYHNTYKTPVLITHTMNVFGERQHPEKFIPLCIKKILNGKKIQIHANKEKTKSGSRFYIYAKRVAQALHFILKKGIAGEKYNIVGDHEITNLNLALCIGEAIGKGAVDYQLVDFHSSRPGHDLRYALSGRRLKAMGFEYQSTFINDLNQTVKWYLNNQEWL